MLSLKAICFLIFKFQVYGPRQHDQLEKSVSVIISSLELGFINVHLPLPQKYNYHMPLPHTITPWFQLHKNLSFLKRLSWLNWEFLWLHETSIIWMLFFPWDFKILKCVVVLCCSCLHKGNDRYYLYLQYMTP